VTQRDLGEFRLQPPVDFALTFAAADSYHAVGRALLEAGRPPCYRRVVRVGEIPALLEIEGSGTRDAPIARARLLASAAPVPVDAAREAAAFMLMPEADWSGFYARAGQLPVLAETVERLHGLRMLRFNSSFEALLVTLIEQQIALRAAQKAERWLAGAFGDTLVFEGERYPALPTAARLATLTVPDLTPLRITFIRMGRLLEIARLEASGELALDRLRAQGVDALYRRLVALHGVGHWTASWTINRALGHFLYFGAADVALRAAMNHYVHGRPGRMDRDAMDTLFAGLGEDAGLAAYFLILRWAFDRAAF
jgi:3-methyladenine DNA glycosylase/8-oxoguanine DNA glycosylase